MWILVVYLLGTIPAYFLEGKWSRNALERDHPTLTFDPGDPIEVACCIWAALWWPLTLPLFYLMEHPWDKPTQKLKEDVVKKPDFDIDEHSCESDANLNCVKCRVKERYQDSVTYVGQDLL